MRLKEIARDGECFSWWIGFSYWWPIHGPYKVGWVWPLNWIVRVGLELWWRIRDARFPSSREKALHEAYLAGLKQRGNQ